MTLAVAAALLATAAPAQAATTHHVRVEDNLFVPKALQIEPGDTVTWTAARPEHTVTADDGRFDFHADRRLTLGEQVSWPFQSEEIVRYHCRIHGGPGGQGMAGVIRVGNPPAPPVPEAPALVVPDDASLTEAAAGARPGTQVLVRPGVYREDVVVTVPGLEIRGLGDHPGQVVVDGANARDVGVTVAAPDVRIANLTVTGHMRAGIEVQAVSGTVIEDAVLDANGLYGVEARGPAGLAVRAARVTGHGVAGIGVRDCATCGARIDDARIEGNAAGVVAVAAAGVVVRGTQIHRNAVGIVLRDSAGAQVVGNTLLDNDATDVWVAAAFQQPEPPTGAGVWIVGGQDHVVAGNTLSGHTYNVAVTGPTPALRHRIDGNTVAAAAYADMGWDGLGAGVCFGQNHGPSGEEPTSDPPSAQTLYRCSAATTAGLPYPVVTVHLAAHAARVDTAQRLSTGPGPGTSRLRRPGR